MQKKDYIKTGTAAASVILTALALQSGIASAQNQQTIVVGSGNPSVEVDLSVLDRLGPQQTVPGLLQPNIPLEVTRRGNRYPAAGANRPGSGGAGVASGGNLLESLRIQPGQARPTLPPMAAPQGMAHQGMAPQPMATFQPQPMQPMKAHTPGQIVLREPGTSMPKPAMAAPKPAMTAPKPAAPAAPKPVAEKPKKVAKAPAAPPPPKIPALPKTEPAQTASAPTKVTPTPTAPPPKPKVPAASVETKPAPQVASVPKKAEDQVQPTKGDKASIAFESGKSALPGAAEGQLSPLIKQMQDDDALRVQLMAYAAADGDSASRARRLSLSRALAVRAHLIEQGIRSTRMDVRALGSKVGDGNGADRVDVILVKR